MKDYEQAKQEIVRVNKLMDSRQLEGLSRARVEEYFMNFRKAFTYISLRVKDAKTAKERKALIKEIVELNGLYGIQLILNIKLPADMEEIAYDYDHDEFPGYEYRFNNILNGNYLVLGGKVTTLLVNVEFVRLRGRTSKCIVRIQ